MVTNISHALNTREAKRTGCREVRGFLQGVQRFGICKYTQVLVVGDHPQFLQMGGG